MATNTLTLFCLISGEPASGAFSVKVNPTATVDDLKDAITSKKPNAFEHIDANDLVLWRVSIPDDDDLSVPLDSVSEKKKLKATTKLSKVFDAELPEDTIHIVVERPQAASTPHTLDLHPEVAALRKQLSEMEQLNVDLRSTSISMAIMDKRSGGNKKICQYQADTMTATLEELRQLLRPHFEQFDGEDYVQVYLYQPGCAMPVLLSHDDVLRSCLKTAKDNGHKNFTVSLDSPAKKFSSYTWKDAQSQYGVREFELMPAFKIQPRSLQENEETVLKHIVEDCVFKNKAYLLGPYASEATRSSVVDTFMVGAMQSYGSEMFLAQQRPMSGMRGHGAVDFAVVDRVHQTQVLGVTEVKKENFAQGLAQNMAELDVAVQQKKRKRVDEVDEDSGERIPASFKSYGIVTDSFSWKLVECSLDEGDVLSFRVKDIPGFLDLKQAEKKDVEKDCRKVFGYVLALYELMKAEIVNRSAYGSPSSDIPPSKRIATGSPRS
ncbi:hypothetical protein BGZ47_001448 [Haplosporangium gracile]|nr:hypothetical protein BGZ47_001448 [Haplosporangium gracile]